MDDIIEDKIAKAPQCMLFADNLVLVQELLEELSADLEVLTKAVEGKGPRVCWKTEFLIINFSAKKSEEYIDSSV